MTFKKSATNSASASFCKCATFENVCVLCMWMHPCWIKQCCPLVVVALTALPALGQVYFKDVLYWDLLFKNGCLFLDCFVLKRSLQLPSFEDFI